MPHQSHIDFVRGKAAIGPQAFALANCIRALSIDAVEAARSGHPGAPIGMADAATALFRDHLKFDAAAPDWPDRDRVVLSNGHASMLLYSVLHLTGYADMTMDQFRNFRQLRAKTAGHPELCHAKGIETTTGPLGLATAVGMAMAERGLAAGFNGLAGHHTYVFLGDGCLQEGIDQEAISLAGHLGLGKLIVLYDDNAITIDAPTSVSFSDDVPARLAACGWHVQSCDGHDIGAVSAAIGAAKAETVKPSLIAMKTMIGFGAPNKAGTAGAHGAPLGTVEAAAAATATAAKEALGWDAAPFVIPDDLMDQWRKIGAKGQVARQVPSLLALSHQSVPQLHREAGGINLSERGGLMWRWTRWTGRAVSGLAPPWACCFASFRRVAAFCALGVTLSLRAMHHSGIRLISGLVLAKAWFWPR